MLLISVLGSCVSIQAQSNAQKKTEYITQTHKESTAAADQEMGTGTKVVLIIFFVCIPFGILILFAFVNRNGGTFRPMP
jgi:hypothetical protein